MAEQIYKVRDPSGAIREIKGPAGATDEQVIAKAKELFGDAMIPQTTLANIAKEAGKGFVRGASDVGMFLGKGATAFLAPELGRIAASKIEELAAPSRKMIAATPNTPIERMVGTGSEILGASAITGGMGSVPRAIYSGISALGGALGEQAGGETGKALGSLAPLGVIGGRAAIRGIKTHAFPSTGQIGAKAAGDKLDDVINALENFKSGVPGVKLTAGQASVPANSAEFAALQKKVSDVDPSRYFTIEDAQKNAMRKHLAALIGADTQEGAILASKEAKRVLGEVVGPKMEQELAAANIAGKLLPKLQEKATALSAASASNVDDVRRLELAKQLAESRANQMYPMNQMTSEGRTGFPRLAGRYSYASDLAERAEDAAQKAAKGSLDTGAGARFAQMQADSLAAHGLRPIDTSKLTRIIEQKLNDPSIGANEVTAKVLSKTNELIKEWTSKGKGIIDASALHEIRKTAVNNEVEKLMAGAKPSAIKARASQILGQVKPLIDDAIESAGGTGWKKALKEFEQGSHLINRKTMGAKALELFDKSPNRLISLSEGNEPKVVEKIFGPGRVSLAKEMGGTETPIKDVGSMLSRNKIYKNLASKGAKSLENRIDAPELPPTGLFQPMISTARGWVNRILGSGIDNAIKRAAPDMADPQTMARLLREYKAALAVSGGGKEELARRAALAAMILQEQQ